jgi:arginyl-tRNA synthetase
MNLMFEPLRKKLTQPLLIAIEKCGVTFAPEEIYKFLVEPPNPDMGHLAFGCFVVSKNLKKSPAIAAVEIKTQLEKIEGVESVEAAGPYLNFKFSSKFLAENILIPILNQKTFSEKLISLAPKTMIEYSQPNTHKELHVGHMRNLCLGDALVRLLRRSYGADQIISSTFPGDVGTHVAKCLWYIKNHVGLNILDQKRDSPDRGEWLGQMYSAGNIKLEDEAEVPEKFEKNKKELTLILKQLESKSGEFYDLWKETRAWSIQLMKKTYEWADVAFDKWYWESDVDADSVRTIKKYFAEGKLVESQGAIGLDFESEKLGFCLLLKSDGTGLYATKDIELARKKFEDFKIEKSIYVVDQRQALHFKQVFRSLLHLGFEQAKDCFHLQYNFVELPDGAMSSRKGNIVPLMLLVEKMQNHVRTEYLSRYENEWSVDELNSVAACVAKGAIKYGMLRQDTNKKIVFDMNEWLKLDGESGPFIQYSYARINSLIKKINISVNQDFDGDLLIHSSEIKLMQHLMNFNTQILLSAENYKPASLCTYLYETAKKFNSFYHDCSISQAESVELKKSRLALAMCTGEILKQGLAVLGIPVPERM